MLTYRRPRQRKCIWVKKYRKSVKSTTFQTSQFSSWKSISSFPNTSGFLPSSSPEAKIKHDQNYTLTWVVQILISASHPLLLPKYTVRIYKGGGYLSRETKAVSTSCNAARTQTQVAGRVPDGHQGHLFKQPSTSKECQQPSKCVSRTQGGELETGTF